jgi:pimeloyl-ACP methyl ester carboxylesterase
MGSLVAFDVAARYPDRVTSLAMVGTSMPMPVGDLLLDNAEKDNHLAKEMINYWSHSTSAHLGGSQVPGIWMLGKLIRLLERSGPGVIYNDLLACEKYTEGIERSKNIQMPTLLILGEDDFMTPIKDAKALAETIPNSRTILIPNCGHAIVSEAPNDMLDALATLI